MTASPQILPLCRLLRRGASRADANEALYIFLFLLLLFRAEIISRGFKVLSKPVSSPGPWLGTAAAAGGADNRICLHARPPARHSPGPRQQDRALDAPLGLLEPGVAQLWVGVGVSGSCTGVFGGALPKCHRGKVAPSERCLCHSALLQSRPCHHPALPKGSSSPQGWLLRPDCHPERCGSGGWLVTLWVEVRSNRDGLGRAGSVCGANLGLSQGSLIGLILIVGPAVGG